MFPSVPVSVPHNNVNLQVPVLEQCVRIRDILVRIRILGSVHLITDPDPALFVSEFQDTNKNFVFFYFVLLNIFCWYRTFTVYQSLKIIKSLRSP
jgi:hypothetical protein